MSLSYVASIYIPYKLEFWICDLVQQSTTIPKPKLRMLDMLTKVSIGKLKLLWNLKVPQTKRTQVVIDWETGMYIWLKCRWILPKGIVNVISNERKAPQQD